jgi:hypothetical protein
MRRVKEEFSEFFKPTARCFKGFAILLFIWGVASLLISALVPTIVLVHNPLINQKNQDFGNGGDVIDPLILASQFTSG